jgi:hypothetical protein
MALAEAVGVASEMRAAAPSLPAADPLPTLLSDFQRSLEGGRDGSREGSPVPRGEAAEAAEAGGGGAEQYTPGGLLGAFLALLVGDVEHEKDVLEEQERAAAESTQEQRAAALKLEQIRAAIAQGVEMEERRRMRQVVSHRVMQERRRTMMLHRLVIRKESFKNNNNLQIGFTYEI